MVVGKEKPHFEFLMTRPARTARTAVIWHRGALELKHLQ